MSPRLKVLNISCTYIHIYVHIYIPSWWNINNMFYFWWTFWLFFSFCFIHSYICSFYLFITKEWNLWVLYFQLYCSIASPALNVFANWIGFEMAFYCGFHFYFLFSCLCIFKNWRFYLIFCIFYLLTCVLFF